MNVSHLIMVFLPVYLILSSLAFANLPGMSKKKASCFLNRRLLKLIYWELFNHHFLIYRSVVVGKSEEVNSFRKVGKIKRVDIIT